MTSMKIEDTVMCSSCGTHQPDQGQFDEVWRCPDCHGAETFTCDCGVEREHLAHEMRVCHGCGAVLCGECCAGEDSRGFDVCRACAGTGVTP